MFPRRPVATLLVALTPLLAAPSCDGPGNTGKVAPDPNLVRDVPWLNGVMPAFESGVTVLPLEPAYPRIGLGVPDPGPGPTECPNLDGYEFAAGWLDTFEPINPGEVGIAPGWSSYDDLSKYAFHTPGDATWYPGLQPDPMTKRFSAPWGLPSQQFPGPSCDGKPNDWVLHFRGGLFRKWGGGLSHAFTDPDGWYRPLLDRTEACKRNNMPVDFCSPPVAEDAKLDSAGLPTTDKKGLPYQQSHDFFDVTKYEGVAFWARRGPEGHDRALVILTDKFTSSRLARGNETFCRRVRECFTRCLSGTPCTPDGHGVNRCWDPNDPQYASTMGVLPQVPIATQMDQMYPRCGASACTSPDTYLDPDFEGKQCRPYNSPAAEESGEFCWNPEDPPPPGRDERCQDGWQSSVPLSLEWRFFAIPFTEFRQAQFGKRADYMDLKSLDTIAFGAVMGWSDFYFDNVTLYRRK